MQALSYNDTNDRLAVSTYYLSSIKTEVYTYSVTVIKPVQALYNNIIIAVALETMNQMLLGLYYIIILCVCFAVGICLYYNIIASTSETLYTCKHDIVTSHGFGIQFMCTVFLKHPLFEVYISVVIIIIILC